MKKIIIFPVAVLALTLVLTGCTRSSQPTEKQTGQDIDKSGRMRQPDFGQPDRTPDVRGIVKSIVGNEVTILKIDRQSEDRNASSTAEQGRVSGGGAAAGNAVSLTGIGGGVGGGRMMGASVPNGPGGPGVPGGPDGPGGPGEQTTATRAQVLAKLKELSTGEEKIIIPVGIRMLKMDTGNNGRTMVEATLADITADKNVLIWINSSAAAAESAIASSTLVATPSKIAEFVLIN